MHTTEGTLTKAEVESFNENGYLGPFTLCSPEEMAGIRDRVVNGVFTNKPSHHNPVQSRHLDFKVVYDLCSHPAIVERMASIMGPDLVLWRSNFFAKEPGALEIPWHQDYGYWPLNPAINISAWVAIDEATPENSCVQIIPGSHKSHYPFVQAPPGMAFNKMTDPKYVDVAKKIDMPLKAGEFFLFNESTLHHSEANRSTKRRIGLAVRVTVPRVKVDHAQLFPGHKVIQLCGTDTYKLNEVALPPEA